MRLHRAPVRIAVLSAAAGLTLALAGCSNDDGAAVTNLGGTGSVPNAASGAEASGAQPTPTTSARAAISKIALAASDTTCALDPAEVAAGVIELEIDPKGPAKTEVYILNGEGGIVTERENIAAGTPVELTSELTQGQYTISCRPEGKTPIDSKLMVTEGTATALTAEEQAAVDGYRQYVGEQVADSVTRTRELVAAIKAGKVAEAKSLYASSRLGWERIEPVAEAFGDIDPKIDPREADLAAGQEFPGWHAIEKGLWKDGSTTGLSAIGETLLIDLGDLVDRIPDAQITPSSMANGAKELLDEVASTKVTGEEEVFSRTDLVDFKGNLDGARKVFELLRPIAQNKDAGLVATLATEFDDVEAALSKYERGAGYVSYDTVTPAQRKDLADVVNALGEPLSRLAAAVV